MDKLFAVEEVGAYEGHSFPPKANHFPPGWEVKDIEITSRGKAPVKKYGPGVYQFGAANTLSVILPRRGWTLVKQTRSYAFFIPPVGHTGDPFVISIAVPSDEQCLEMAQQCYVEGFSWDYQLGEWPASYLHERNCDMQKIWRDPITGEMIHELLPSPARSQLFIGEYGVWERAVTGEHGTFILGHLPPSTSPFQADPIATPKIKKQTDSLELFEGTPKTVELTVYERNPVARQKCIEHFGASCLACGFNYETKYGSIGAGLIHVHHVTPLAEIGQEYQIDPLHDLIPLCASCHHVVHRRSPPYSLSEIRQAIAQQVPNSNLVF